MAINLPVNELDFLIVGALPRILVVVVSPTQASSLSVALVHAVLICSTNDLISRLLPQNVPFLQSGRNRGISSGQISSTLHALKVLILQRSKPLGIGVHFVQLPRRSVVYGLSTHTITGGLLG